MCYTLIVVLIFFNLSKHDAYFIKAPVYGMNNKPGNKKEETENHH